MDSGAYRNRITLQKYFGGKDEIGNPDGSWEDWKEAYAYVNGLSGSEYWEAAAVQQESTVEFVFRWHDFFEVMDTKRYRLMFRGKIYNIKMIDNIQFRNKTVKIRAVARDGNKNQYR